MPLPSVCRDASTKDRELFVVTMWGGSTAATGACVWTDAAGVGFAAGAGAGAGVVVEGESSFAIEFVVMSVNFALKASAARRADVADARLSLSAVVKFPRPEFGTKAGSGASNDVRGSASSASAWEA
ncbi:protein of unknown function [Hyphomicrobium sp. MC1]|nr:protein of unknown function [Hyphomicrobium sp. MC1]